MIAARLVQTRTKARATPSRRRAVGALARSVGARKPGETSEHRGPKTSSAIDPRDTGTRHVCPSKGHREQQKTRDSTRNFATNAMVSPKKTTEKPSARKRPGKAKDRTLSFKERLEDGVEELAVKLKKSNDGNYKLLAPGTPFDEVDLSEGFFKDGKHVHLTEEQSWRSWAFGRKFFFPAGILLGVLVAIAAMGPMSKFPTSNDMMEIWANLPSTLDPRDLLNNLTVVETARKAMENRDFTIGEKLVSNEGLTKHHPVILIPGIVSTGLESWGTEPLARPFFRKRLWGTTTMIRAVISDKERWLQALSLDPETGLDPAGFKVRAAQGLDAASEFIQGYWIWQKIVENLATLGYDSNSMDMAAYDWRLSYYNLEVRDAYFTRLKNKIEIYKKTNGQKVVLCSHSMGGTVIQYFMKWVEAQPDEHGFGGDGGPTWVEDHVEAWINVAGSLLGVTKAMTAFLSGEMRDTVEINPAGSWVLEKFFSRKERAKLFRRWPGASSMWTKGGNRIWGSDDNAPDDPANATDSHGRFLSFRHMQTSSDEADISDETVSPNLTMSDASNYVLLHTPPSFQRMIQQNYSYGFENDPIKLKENAKDHRKWSNPLEVQLPYAPSMKIYCIYGHGKETERSYFYMQGPFEQDDSRSDALDAAAMCDAADPSNNCDNATTSRNPLDFPLARQQWIDSVVSVKGSIPEVRSGVKFGEGDGTISTISLGTCCVKTWFGQTAWNPAGIKVVTQELLHQPQEFDLRGGPKTADHVDILGNGALNEAILRIAGGRGDLVQETIYSDIKAYADKMDWD